MAVGEYPRAHGNLSGLSDTDHHIQYALDSQGLLSARPIAGRAGRYYYATDTALLYRDTGTSWVTVTAPPTAKTFRIPHTFTVPGDVRAAIGDTDYIPPFFVPVPTGQTVTLAAVRTRINSGTSVTFDVRKTDLNFGMAGVVATPTTSTNVGTNAQAARVFADGDALSVVVTAVAGTPKNLTATLYLDYTV